MAFYDSAVFNLCAQTNDPQIKAKHAQSETEALYNYEKGLKEVQESLGNIDYKPLISSFNKISTNIKHAVDDHKKKLRNIEELEMESKEKQINSNDDLRQQIAHLREENDKLNEELGLQAVELDALLEEKFALKSSSESQTDNSQPQPNYGMNETFNKAISGAINNYLKIVMCPLCQTNRRDCIISSCGHAFCRKCLVRRKTCPSCGQRFIEPDLRKLRFN